MTDYYTIIQTEIDRNSWKCFDADVETILESIGYRGLHRAKVQIAVALHHAGSHSDKSATINHAIFNQIGVDVQVEHPQFAPRVIGLLLTQGHMILTDACEIPGVNVLEAIRLFDSSGQDIIGLAGHFKWSPNTSAEFLHAIDEYIIAELGIEWNLENIVDNRCGSETIPSRLQSIRR